MRRISALLLILLLVTPVLAQVKRSDSIQNAGDRLYQPGKIGWGVTLGSEFSAISGYGSGINSFVAPYFSYNLNKRLQLGGGISFIQTNYFKTRAWFQGEQKQTISGNFSNAIIFVNGQYLVNERLTISGSAYKQFPAGQDPLPYNPFSPVSSRGAQGINFDMGYRIGDHMYIQAGFRYSDGRSPYYPDSFNRDPFRNDRYVPAVFGRP